MFLLRLPLHYQILIALVLGTILGLMLNPGEIELPDERVTISLADGIVVIARDNAEAEERLSLERFRRQYPELAQEFLSTTGAPDAADGDPSPMTFDVMGRRAHLGEDGKRIRIQYTRRVKRADAGGVRDGDGRTIVSTYTAGSAAELIAEHPQWRDVYAEHGGGFSRRVIAFARTIGDFFLKLLKMVTVPLIVTSLITGVAGLGSGSRLGAMFGKTLAYYALTSALAISVGLALVNLIRPGVGAELPGGGEGAVAPTDQTLGGIFLNLLDRMIPDNPVQALAAGDFLAIITFSILIGLFIIRTGGESGDTLRRFFRAAFDVVMQLTLFIIRLAPIGVLAFMLYATASQGLEVFRTLAWYMLTVFLALAVHAFIVLPLILYFVARRSPWEYLKAMSPALMTAFSTASSNGTLPLTITCAEERAGIPNRVSSFVLPLGATVNMDGTALYEAVAVLFIAQATPGFAMTFEAQLVVALTALLASVGAAGIPHAGLVMMAIVLQAVGLPLEAQGVIIAVDRVLDMCRTSVNVWSDSCGCAVLARLEPEVPGPAGDS